MPNLLPSDAAAPMASTAQHWNRPGTRRSHRGTAAEGAALRELDQAWHGARDRGQFRARRFNSVASPSLGMERSARSCRGGVDGEHVSDGPVSTIRPAYITATRSAISATTPRLCVTNRMPMPRSACSFCRRSRIWAWIVTSSAVVGSSAISKTGRRQVPLRSWHVGACRQRARAGIARHAARVRNANMGQEFDRRTCRACSCAAMDAHGLGDLLADGEDRIEARHGLLEHHGDVIAPDLPQAFVELVRSCIGPDLPRNKMLPDHLPYISGSSPMIERLVTDLPDPDSPTSAKSRQARLSDPDPARRLLAAAGMEDRLQTRYQGSVGGRVHFLPQPSRPVERERSRRFLQSSSALRVRCGRAIVLVAIMPRERIAVLKAPTPAAPPLARGSETQTISKRRHSRSCSLRAASQSPARLAPQSHVAVGIHIGKPRNDAMCSHLKGGVDDDLGAGHEKDVGFVREIKQAEAEVTVVAARILEAGDGVLAGQRQLFRARAWCGRTPGYRRRSREYQSLRAHNGNGR